MTAVIALLAAPLALVTCCFAVEILFGLAPLRHRSFLSSTSAAVLVVPAHDEEIVIGPTLLQLKEAAGAVRILVVADNCTDNTPMICRQLGVDVIERTDSERRGKGFALDFAREYLKSNPPAVVLIVDADCSIDAKSISLLVNACAALKIPCQATNLQRPSPEASPSVQISTFAFFIKNVIRQRALERLAGRVHLLGTGMAFPWSIFEKAELATSNIVEDLKLGHELASSGHAPVFIESAAVWSRAESDANTIAQRRRWEGGFLQHALRAAPRLLLNGLTAKDRRQIWAALDLMIPPFALLLLLDGLAVLLLGFLTWIASAQLWPLFTLCVALALALLGLCFAWSNGGSKFVPVRSLIQAPLYIGRKLPMYLGFARRGVPKEWQRTGR